MATAEECRTDVLVDLALQGGGSHGAFTWGVLDRLLEEPWLNIEAISGTSAGAMNGAGLVSGYMKGGAEGARAAVDRFGGRGRRSPPTGRECRKRRALARSSARRSIG